MMPVTAQREPRAPEVGATGRAEGNVSAEGISPGRATLIVTLIGIIVTVSVAWTAGTLNDRMSTGCWKSSPDQAAAVLSSTILSIRDPLETSLQIEAATGAKRSAVRPVRRWLCGTRTTVRLRRLMAGERQFVASDPTGRGEAAAQPGLTTIARFHPESGPQPHLRGHVPTGSWRPEASATPSQIRRIPRWSSMPNVRFPSIGRSRLRATRPSPT